MTNIRRARRQIEPPARRAGGFTLIEMMTTLIILAILVALTVPSFNNASLSGKLTGFANDLVASAQLARSEAIKRNVAVTLCASTGGTACDGPEGWEAGWIVLGPAGVIERHPPLPPEFRVIQGDEVSNIVFPATVAGTTSGTFTVCRADPTGSQERVVTISVSGSTRVSRTETSTCPE